MLDALGGLLVGLLVVVLFMVVGTVWFVAGLFRRRGPRREYLYTDPNATAGDVGRAGGHRRDGDGGSDGGWFGGSDGGADGGGGGGGD